MALDLWQQVQQVFDAALQHSPEKRQEFLEQECGSNQELRREVESLLAAHDESGSFMAKPAVAGMAEVLHRATSRFHPGDTLGAYKVLDLVGRGGMGEVYRARDTRLKRDVAIKVLPRAFAADRERLRRFEQEARSAAALNHPNIISVHDMGTADGSPYIVSELLEGQNLREVLRQGAVPARKALDYSMQAAGGLAAAHDVGIIHRDLKPENLFITKDGHLKILDFGLAKLMRPEGGGSDSSTAEAVPGTEAGRVFGTVGYMSPEQVRGQSADHRSDIFSFGTILYELFSGKRAFSGDSPTDTMSAILHQDPPELTRATPPVHPMVDHTIRHCLEKNPLERFQSAHDLRFQLQVAAEGLSPQPETAAIQVDAKPATASLTIAVSGERLRRTVGVMAALATLVLALSAAAAWWVLRSRPENRAGSAVRDDAARRVLAVLPFDNISNDRSQDYFSAGVTEEINGQLSKLASLQVLSRTAVARYKDPKSNLRQIATELGVGSVVLGSVRQEGSRVRIHVEVVDPRNDRTVWSDQYDRELKDIFAVQSDVALRIADALQAKLTSNEQERIEKRSTENMAAYQIYLRSQELKSSDRQKNLEALRMLQQAIQLDPKFAVAQARMAYRTIFQSYFDDPQYIDSGMEMARKALALDASLADAHFALAFGYYQKGQATNARLSLLKAIELTPSHDGAMMNLSAQETDLGRYNEALNWARRAFRLAPSGIAYYHVGYPLLYLGDDATTEKWLTEGEQHFPNGMRIQILLAMLDLLRGRERDALERARKAAVVESGSEEISMLLADLALITGAADAESRVERFFRSAPDLSAGMWILPESFRVRYAYLLARRGETSRATQLMEQAASLARQTLDNGNELPRVRLELAAIYAVRQQKKPALDWLQEAYDAGWRDPRTLERDPMFQDLREEPRFKELLGRLKRDVAAMRERSSDLRELLTTAAPKSSNSSPKPSQ